MKNIIFFFIVFCNTSFAQTLKCPKNAIIYELPENIQSKLDSAARKYSDNFKNKYSYLHFSNCSDEYSINFHSSKGVDEKHQKLLKYTTRYLHIKDRYYPLVFAADYDLSRIVNVIDKDGLKSTTTYIGAPYYITFKLLKPFNEVVILEEGSIQ
jgi:hypothetical protein